jgi:DUF1680 family protein
MNMPAFQQVLAAVDDVWKTRRDDVTGMAERLTSALGAAAEQAASQDPLTDEILAGAIPTLRYAYDPEWGGFGSAPKFPPSAAIGFLLRQHARTGSEDALAMARGTLDAMSLGGMHDLVGGGFHRYAVDRVWLVPHFEKMLYDNAQLATAYLEAWAATGEPRYRDVADYFWREVTAHRSYCTGGTSNGEGWDSEPGIIAGELSGYTQEDCVTYNMQKLTRHVFGWSADPSAADYYERALFNGILGVQHPADGSKLYYVPLQSGFWKLFGTPTQDYWCCTGSMSEAFAKLGDSIYFHDDDGVWVNLFAASELDWSEKGVRLVQDTRFPEEAGTTVTVRAARPVQMTLRVRVPYWAGRGAGARLNGRPLEGFASPGSYFTVDRTWHDGDTLSVSLPMRLHMAPTPDDATVQAVMYGPLVLVGKLGITGLTPDMLRAVPTPPRQVPGYRLDPVAVPELHSSGAPEDWIQPVAGRPLEFRTVRQAQDVTLVPFYQLFDERYGLYWKVQASTAGS